MFKGNLAEDLVACGPRKAPVGEMAPCVVCDEMTAARYGTGNPAFPICVECGSNGRAKTVLTPEQMEYQWRYGLDLD